MKHDFCPVCGSESKFSFDTKYVTVHNCLNNKCDHYFAVQAKFDQGVCEYNLNKDYSIYNERNDTLIKYWESIGFISNEIKLLDIGTGFGHLLEHILRSYPKISITCVEPSNSYREVLAERGYNVYNDITSVPIEQFDSILLIEVIEHVQEPMNLLIEARKRLNKNGRLLLTTPAGNVYPKTNSPVFLEAYNNSTHIQFFTKRSIRYALSNAGFNKIKYRYIPALYVNKPGSKYSNLKQVLRKYYLYYRGQTTHLTYVAS